MIPPVILRGEFFFAGIINAKEEERMNLLFIDGGSRCFVDVDGNIYVGANLNHAVQERYKKFCDKLTILEKTDGKIYPASEIPKGTHIIDKNLADFVTMPDLYRPRKNLFSFSIRREITRIMSEAIQKADRVIIRIGINYYTTTAERLCRKYRKPYSIECVECVFEMNWNYGLEGKIIAPFSELKAKRMISRASHVLYVTGSYLQDRYPTKGKTVSCSNVELEMLDDSVIDSRIKHIHESGGKIIFGTAAFMGTYIKGQEYVIRALSILKAKGITNIEYRLAGSGSAENLVRLAESLGVNDQLKVYGVLPHDEIFAWYDDLDVYIQPSFQEGLCRAIIEAMSRALPVTCSHVGGNPELVTPDMIFHAGNVKQIATRMEMMLDPAIREREARKSFTKAHEFSKDILDRRRGEFYSEFTGVKNW